MYRLNRILSNESMVERLIEYVRGRGSIFTSDVKRSNDTENDRASGIRTYPRQSQAQFSDVFQASEKQKVLSSRMRVLRNSDLINSTC